MRPSPPSQRTNVVVFQSRISLIAETREPVRAKLTLAEDVSLGQAGCMNPERASAGDTEPPGFVAFDMDLKALTTQSRKPSQQRKTSIRDARHCVSLAAVIIVSTFRFG